MERLLGLLRREGFNPRIAGSDGTGATFIAAGFGSDPDKQCSDPNCSVCHNGEDLFGAKEMVVPKNTAEMEGILDTLLEMDAALLREKEKNDRLAGIPIDETIINHRRSVLQMTVEANMRCSAAEQELEAAETRHAETTKQSRENYQELYSLHMKQREELSGISHIGPRLRWVDAELERELEEDPERSFTAKEFKNIIKRILDPKHVEDHSFLKDDPTCGRAECCQTSTQPVDESTQVLDDMATEEPEDNHDIPS